MRMHIGLTESSFNECATVRCSCCCR